MASNNLLTYEDLKALLGVPRGTAYSLVARRQIPHIRLGPRTVRFRRADIERWLDDHSVILEHSDAGRRDELVEREPALAMSEDDDSDG